MKEQITESQAPEVDFLSPDDKNPLYYTTLLFDLILSYDNNKTFNPLKKVNEFFSWVEKIASSEIRKKVFFYFLEHHVATVPVLAAKLTIPQPSVYREVNNLYYLEILEKVVESRIFRRRRGRSPTVFGFRGQWVPDDLVKAVQAHNDLKSGTFVLVATIGQTILDDHIVIRNLDEITIREVAALCKGNCKGYYTWDIAKQVGHFLEEQGVKVFW